ncbi:MAG: glycosyltransferase family 2 protein [Melioribacteraceae bacterium]|nr:glycosyltransferase family 2 protein [Melioribacteraceae bacterium]
MENSDHKSNDSKEVMEKVKSSSSNLTSKPSKSGKFKRSRRTYFKNSRNTNKPAQAIKKSGDSLSKISYKKVCVLVPLYNEEESLGKLAKEIDDVFQNIAPDYEILFIDDGSNDNSLKVIKDIARANRKIRYISFRKNYGKSAALNVGFKNVSGDVVITMDADLQDDPSEIPNLLQELQKGYDLVSGWKKQRHDPFIKKYSSRFFNYVTKIMSGIKIHDFNCGLKAYKRAVVKSISVQGELHRYIPVLADWKGFKVSEVVVKHHPRRYGKTKFGISRFFKGFIDLITVIFTTRYIQRPLHFFGMLGVVTFITGFTIDAYLSILWFLDKITLSNRPILYLGTVLIIVGVQFFSLGLIGEMLVHNNKKEDSYGIREKKLKSTDQRS